MTVLDEIVAGVREDLAVRQQAVSLDELKKQAAQAVPPRDALAVLGSDGVSVIAEVKRASPSKGQLATIVDPAQLAQSYVEGGASVISVLTEQRRFSGSLADLTAVRAAVDIPVLRKDFIVSSYQLWEARADGADLALLIVAALDKTRWCRWSNVPSQSGSPRWLKCTMIAELQRAVDAGARVIGVNARNLATLEVDRDTFATVAPSVPAGIVRVAESGVRGPHDLIAYANAGADAVLVGESLVTGRTHARQCATWSRRAHIPHSNTVAPERRQVVIDTPLLQRFPMRCGHFGNYGGRFVPEALIAALDELDAAYRLAQSDPAFVNRLADLQRTYTGRPSPLTDATRFSEHAGGARVLLKREDLNHTGSHKINNVLGQALLTQRMGKRRVIAETGAGQHGVATATAAALLGLECVVYMGEEDTRRQALNVARMELLGAEVIPVTVGSQTLKDAINEAMRDWVTNVDDTHYLLGTVAGPAPLPGDGARLPPLYWP